MFPSAACSLQLSLVWPSDEESRRELDAALEAHDRDAIMRILDFKGSARRLEAFEAEQSRARLLLAAAKECSVNEADELLKAGASVVDARDAEGNTPLHVAAHHDCEGVAHSLLAAGAAVDSARMLFDRELDNCTALHVAAREGSLHVVKALLKAGASVDARDAEGNTPLYFAAKHGHVATTKALVECGRVTRRVTINKTDKFGKLPQDVAESTTRALVALPDEHTEALKRAARAGSIDALSRLLLTHQDAKRYLARTRVEAYPSKVMAASFFVGGIILGLAEQHCRRVGAVATAALPPATHAPPEQQPAPQQGARAGGRVRRRGRARTAPPVVQHAAPYLQ